MTLTQITEAKDILSLRDYYLLALETSGTDAVTDRITRIATIRIKKDRIVRDAVVDVSDSDDSSYPEKQIAESLSRILFDSTIVAEPDDLLFLRNMFDRWGYDGELRFLPLLKLADALFPGYAGQGLSGFTEFLDLQAENDDPLLRDALLEDELLQACKEKLGGRKRAEIRRQAKKNRDLKQEPVISDMTLKSWAKALWSVAPWQLGLVFLVLFFIAVLLFPRGGSSSAVNRESAPINYLVLSWDQTGKYGTKSRAKDSPIEFRIPYGVYNILNNNSIPVEVSICTELTELKASEDDRSDTGEVQNTASDIDSSSPFDDNKKNDDGITTVIIRPSSSREITIDEHQYLTLSDNATELILFYVSTVPEEVVSTNAGQVSEQAAVVYNYVKGTDVRFRAAPSLEGEVIKTLNNGQQVQVLGVVGEWTAVAVQDQRGYIFSTYLTSEDPNAGITD